MGLRQIHGVIGVRGGNPARTSAATSAAVRSPTFSCAEQAPAVTYSAEATALFATQPFLSPSLTNVRKTAIAAFIDGCVTDGTWAKIKAIWWFGAHNSDAALLNWKNPSGTAAAPVNAPTFTVDRGFTGDGTTSYVNHGVSPSSLGIVLNSECFFGLTLTDVAANTYDFGSMGSALIPRRSTGNNVSVNSQTTTVTSGAAGTMTTSVGFAAVNRSGSTNSIYYKDGAAYETITRASVAVSTDNIFSCGRNNGSGAVSGASTRQIGMVGFASSLTAGEIALLNTRVQTFRQHLGA